MAHRFTRSGRRGRVFESRHLDHKKASKNSDSTLFVGAFAFL